MPQICNACTNLKDSRKALSTRMHPLVTKTSRLVKPRSLMFEAVRRVRVTTRLSLMVKWSPLRQATKKNRESSNKLTVIHMAIWTEMLMSSLRGPIQQKVVANLATQHLNQTTRIETSTPPSRPRDYKTRQVRETGIRRRGTRTLDKPKLTILTYQTCTRKKSYSLHPMHITGSIKVRTSWAIKLLLRRS